MIESAGALNPFSNQVKAADEPVKALFEDMNRAYNHGDFEGFMRILGTIQGMIQSGKEIKPVSALKYIQTDPPTPVQVLRDTFDIGDKVAILGSSKQRKSFFILQMCISLAAGLDFLIWKNAVRRRVLLVQFEVKEAHYHKRVRNMADALDIDEDSIKDNLLIVNARGLGINSTGGIPELSAVAKKHGAEIIVFDPLYKLMDGSENSPEAFKPVLDAFDLLAEDTGAAICYVHHDAKGAAGDRDIRDRGAGSNVLGRDYDACIALSPHRSEEGATVVEILVRNYRPRRPFCIEWIDGLSSSSCFIPRCDLDPVKETSLSKKKSINSKLPIASFEMSALALVKDKPLPISVFKNQLRHDMKMTVVEAQTFADWATDPAVGKLAIHEQRGRGNNTKLIGLPDQITKLSAKEDV
jgi:hypothetical protein